MHRWKRVRTKSTPRTRKTAIVGPRWSRMRVSRRRIKMVLVRGPEGAVSVLLQFDKGALRYGRRVAAFVGRRRTYMTLAGHRRRSGRILVWAPERGPKIGEVQRRERFVIHFDGVW